MPDRRKEIGRHLSTEEIDEAINDAQKADETRLVRRLICLKNLYAGDTLNQAAWRVGVDESTVSEWSDDWNDHGLGGSVRASGADRPPKLSKQQSERLKRVLAEYQPWTTTEIKILIEDAFDLSYSQRHISRLLRKFRMNYAIPRPESPDRPVDAEEMLDERLQEALAEMTDESDEADDIMTDGGVVIGFLDEAWPQPTDNRRRLWAFGTPTIQKTTPTENFEDAVIGFYALNGVSVVRCKPDVTKESFAEVFLRIREQNPTGGFCSSAITSRRVLRISSITWLSRSKSPVFRYRAIHLILIQSNRFGTVFTVISYHVTLIPSKHFGHSSALRTTTTQSG